MKITKRDIAQWSNVKSDHFDFNFDDNALFSVIVGAMAYAIANFFNLPHNTYIAVGSGVAIFVFLFVKFTSKKAFPYKNYFELCSLAEYYNSSCDNEDIKKEELEEFRDFIRKGLKLDHIARTQKKSRSWKKNHKKYLPNSNYIDHRSVKDYIDQGIENHEAWRRSIDPEILNELGLSYEHVE